MALTFPEFLPFNERALKHQRNAIVSLERELEVPLPGTTRRVLEVGDALIVAGDYGLLTLRR